jgi:hypothetical protein
MRDQNNRESTGFIVMYSITSRASFMEVSTYRDQVLRVKDVDCVPMILVGNKCDLEEKREVSTQEGIDLAKAWGSEHLETSAKSRLNVDEAFYLIARTVCSCMMSRFQLVQRVTLLVLCANRYSRKSAFSRLPRDVIVIVAKMVLSSYTDVELWKSNVDREIMIRKGGKQAKSKFSIQ